MDNNKDVLLLYLALIEAKTPYLYSYSVPVRK